jgi:hypothetical protein
MINVPKKGLLRKINSVHTQTKKIVLNEGPRLRASLEARRVGGFFALLIIRAGGAPPGASVVIAPGGGGNNLRIIAESEDFHRKFSITSETFNRGFTPARLWLPRCDAPNRHFDIIAERVGGRGGTGFCPFVHGKSSLFLLQNTRNIPELRGKNP